MLEVRRPRVIIVEDFVLLQENIRLLLEPECDVVAVAEDCESALTATLELAPEILTIDVSLPGASGFTLAESVKRFAPATRVVFVTSHGDKDYIEKAFELGAQAYVLKSAIHSDLRVAIRAVMSGGRFLSPRLQAKAVRKEPPLKLGA